jgi:hypothetical protein
MAGLTQIRLAKLTAISQARLSCWENHEVELSSAEVKGVATARPACVERNWKAEESAARH